MTLQPLATLPQTCDVAFKEWEGVCDALARGDQTVIFRKGGIAEAGGTFVVEHRVFWLYPTVVHQAEQGLKTGQERDWSVPGDQGMIGLNLLAIVEQAARVDRLEQLEALSRCHVWTAETVARRFHYREPGLWVLVPRIFRRRTPFFVPVTATHAGCKTWVPLGQPVSTAGLEPAIDDRLFQLLSQSVRDVLEPASKP
jgi:hypothetical protein